MSCRCCQQGGDDDDDSSWEEESQEEKEEEKLASVISASTSTSPTLSRGGGGVESLDLNGVVKDRVQSFADAGITEIPIAYVRPLEDRPRNVVTQARVPVIDLRSGADGDDDGGGGGGSGRRAAIRAEIGRACEDWGFFQVVNHGVPLEILDAMRKDGRTFFGLPMEEKLRYACKAGTVAAEGYGSKMLVKDDQMLDWRDYLDLHTLPLSRRQASNWPSHPSSFRQTVVQYSEEMRLLAQRLLGLISESLGLPTSHIKGVMGEPSQNVSVNYYPACPQPDLTLGLQAHSDLGAITVLMQADIAGLQVYNNGSWVEVQPLVDALVVNLGDMMEVMSNGRYKSVEHRAVVNGKRDRLSVATFLDPAKDQVLSPASTLIDDKSPAVYKDVVFKDFIAAWYSKGPDGKRNIDNLVIPGCAIDKISIK